MERMYLNSWGLFDNMVIRRKVKRIIDGDTFIVSRKIGNTNRIRLAGVDAPERYQFGGKKAMNRLRGLIGGKTVTIVPVGRSFNRIVANIRKNRKSVNKRLK